MSKIILLSLLLCTDSTKIEIYPFKLDSITINTDSQIIGVYQGHKYFINVAVKGRDTINKYYLIHKNKKVKIR